MSFADRRMTLSGGTTGSLPDEKSQWITPRRILALAAGIVALHLLQQAIFGTSPAGSLIANLLQILSALLAATCCIAAIRSSSGFTQSFWLLIGLSFVVWTVADLGWMYYESFLHISPPRNSIFHFIAGRSTAFSRNRAAIGPDRRESWVLLRSRIGPGCHPTIHHLLTYLSRLVSRPFHAREPHPIRAPVG